MYKIDYSTEKIMITICNIAVLITMIVFISMLISTTKEISHILICILFLLFEIIVAFAARKNMEDKKWLAKNGKIIRNLPFKRETVYDEISPSKRSTRIIVKCKIAYNKEVEFIKTFSRFDKIPDQAIDVIYDEKYPEYRYYLGFDIEETKE